MGGALRCPLLRRSGRLVRRLHQHRRTPRHPLGLSLCSASWSGDYGYATNGLAFSEIPDPGGFGGDSSGVTYSAISSPGEEFEVPCSPSAFAFTADPPEGPYAAATAVVAYTVEVGDIKIALSGGLPANPGASYLVGQKCTAQVVCDFTPPLSITSRTWSVSGGDPFKQWAVVYNGANYGHEPGVNTAQRVDLSGSDWTQETFTCFFARMGGVEISCNAQIAVPQGAKPEYGLTIDLDTGTRTEPPSVSNLELNTATVVLTSSPSSSLVLSSGAEPDLGFWWETAVATLPQYVVGTDKGIWTWVQTVSLGSSRTIGGGTELEWCGTLFAGYWRLGLDAFISDPVPGYEWSADGTNQYTGDCPVRFMAPPATGYSIRDDFETFLMDRPPGDGEWVPLRKIEWNWGGGVSCNGTKRVLGASTHNARLG